MAVTSSRRQFPVEGPGDSNDSHPEFAWIPVMVLFVFALIIFILVGGPG